MTSKTKITPKFITVDGVRARVRYNLGNYVSLPESTITIYPSGKNSNYFPKEFKKVFAIDNESDIMTDYFDNDRIRVFADHPLYAEVLAASNSQG